ncbi:peptidase M24 [Synergistales bacterium]|nr:peptidase M24 [Synergistales bacterium]
MNFDVISARVAKLRALMSENGMDAFMLFVLERLNSESCRYISGFDGSSAALLIDARRTLLFTDGRYQTQVSEQSPFTPHIQVGFPIADFVAEAGYASVGFESQKLYHGVALSMFRGVEEKEKRARVPRQTPEWKDASSLIPSLRRTKDATEADAIRRAGVIARKAYDTVLEEVKVGMTESEFESRLLSEIKKGGGEKGWTHDGFIVASGKRSAMCHARPTQKAFEPGDIVTVDFGVTVEGYMCDVTRNFALRAADDKALEIDKILREAHAAAAAALRPGVSGKDVDAAARKVITDAGYGKNFIHGLGHGLGLEVHESPRLSFLTQDILQAGDVVTIEPGIYIEGWGGLRVEDDYIITENGAECLTFPGDQALRTVG